MEAIQEGAPAGTTKKTAPNPTLGTRRGQASAFQREGLHEGLLGVLLTVLLAVSLALLHELGGVFSGPVEVHQCLNAKAGENDLDEAPECTQDQVHEQEEDAGACRTLLAEPQHRAKGEEEANEPEQPNENERKDVDDPGAV